ncbi:hypothetical protein BQ1740_0091 [Bacillus subtilis]|nr:hypothetical protein BQ1740_0091 [Bacillus subtilis]
MIPSTNPSTDSFPKAFQKKELFLFAFVAEHPKNELFPIHLNI